MTAGIKAEPAPQPKADNAACAIAEPVKLVSIAAPGPTGAVITLPDGPVVACGFASSFGAWAGQVAAPVLAAHRGAVLRAIRTGPGFQCRTRDHLTGAKMSTHSLGLAIDVIGFEFADGGRLPVASPPSGKPDPAFAAIRRAACGWFTTVLGPGSDSFHADNLHLDVQLHGSSDRYRICQ